MSQIKLLDKLDAQRRLDRELNLQWQYSGFADLLFNHGTFFNPAPLEPPLAMVGRYMQHIHGHCLSVAQRVSAFHYVEGFAFMNGSIVVPSVWLVNRENQAFDLFYPYDAQRVYVGIEVNPSVVVLRRWTGVFHMGMEARAGFPILTGYLPLEMLKHDEPWY